MSKYQVHALAKSARQWESTAIQLQSSTPYLHT